MPLNGALAPLDVARVRADFPLLDAQRPRQAADLLRQREHVAEAARGHRGGRRFLPPSQRERLARRAHARRGGDGAYEATRDKLARFINAPSRDEIVFTSGTTQAINLVAYSYLLPRLQPGDEILVTTMEHHANIVPWQLLGERAGAKLKVAPITEKGELDRRGIHRAADAARQARGHRARVERARHDQPDRRARARGAQARHSAARRRLAGDAAHAGRRARARLRFLRADRPQDVRPDRHRRALGAQGTPARHAAVLRRRRDDPRSALRRHDVRRSAAPLRSRHAEHRGFRRARRRDRLHGIARPRAHRRVRARAARIRDRCAEDRCPAFASSARRRTRRR